jgi:hypothetical protein
LSKEALSASILIVETISKLEIEKEKLIQQRERFQEEKEEIIQQF